MFETTMHLGYSASDGDVVLVNKPTNLMGSGNKYLLGRQAALPQTSIASTACRMSKAITNPELAWTKPGLMRATPEYVVSLVI